MSLPCVRIALLSTPLAVPTAVDCRAVSLTCVDNAVTRMPLAATAVDVAPTRRALSTITVDAVVDTAVLAVDNTAA